MANSPPAPSSHTAPAPPRIPPLEHGDHLTREEFARRYAAMPNVKAELIEGVVFLPSPMSHRYHSQPQSRVNVWTSLYFLSTPGIDLGDNATVKLDDRNEPQPDALLFTLPSHGGRVRLDDDGYIVGAPDWVGEVAASRVSYDLHVKMQTYRRHAVQEYMVWRVLDRAIDWFVLRSEDFVPLQLSSEGFYKSEVFPGLWLDPTALIADDMARVQKVVQLGVASHEHRQFVEQLARKAARP